MEVQENRDISDDAVQDAVELVEMLSFLQLDGILEEIFH